MISPQIDAPQVSIAEEQEEYKTVTGALARNSLYGSQRPDGVNTVILAFRPDEHERAVIANGGDFYVGLLTFGGAMQPIIVAAGKEDMARMHGLEVTP
jgi:hypothetical protein